MTEKKHILADIYKYYAVNLGKENITKELCRQNKIANKEEDGKKLLQGIINIVKGYTVVDWTDYESCCYEFKILLAKNQSLLDDDKELIKLLKGVRKDLRIFISVLEPYFYMFIEETKYTEIKNEWVFNTIKTCNAEERELLKKINRYLLEKGYRELSKKDATMSVPNIQTELKEINNVNVFDCLFTDLVNI